MTTPPSPSPERYLRVDYACQAGLDHQASNLAARCQLACFLRAALVPSAVFLQGRAGQKPHETCLDEFIDLSALMVAGKPLPTVSSPPGDIPSKSLEVRMKTPLEAIQTAVQERTLLILQIRGPVRGALLRQIAAFREATEHNERHYTGPDIGTFCYPIASEPTRIAGVVAERIGRPYACVHVRRGDRMTDPGAVLVAEHRTYTRLDEIKKAIDFAGCPKVYIMSDEDPDYFAPLRGSEPQIFLHTDFPELRALDDPKVHGGHMLYPVERDLMRRADRRVVTRPQPLLAFEYADRIREQAAYDYSLIPPHIPPNPRP